MTFFLTGGAGLVGSNFIRVATERDDHEVFAALHQNNLKPRQGLGMERLELTDADAVLSMVRQIKPDAIVHMAFFNDLAKAYELREAAFDVMVNATRHLRDAAEALAIPLLFVSTDWVFDGTQAVAHEHAPPNPVNLYGVNKVIGETLVTEYEKGIVARIAGVYGVNWERGGRALTQNLGFGNLPNMTVAQLSEGKPFRVWMTGQKLNLRATPSLASDCCDRMIRLIEREAHGIFHCVGGDHVNRLEYARASARAFDLEPDLIESAPVDPQASDLPAHVAIPEDTRVDGGYTSSVIGRPPMSLDEGLHTFRGQLEQGVL